LFQPDTLPAPAVGEMSRSAAIRRGRGGRRGTTGRAENLRQRCIERGGLRLGEVLGEVLPDPGMVARSRFRERATPGVGEHHNGSTPVCRAGLAGDEPMGLHAVHQPADPAAGEHDAFRKLLDSEPVGVQPVSAGPFGLVELHEHVVVGQREVVARLQLLFQPPDNCRMSVDEGAPNPKLAIFNARDGAQGVSGGVLRGCCRR
jgi:hypothetical protein